MNLTQTKLGPETAPDSLISEWKQVYSTFGWNERLYHYLRETAVFALSCSRPIDRSSGWIRILYYHSVFDDERAGFKNQLNYIRNYAEFASLDDAVSMLDSGDSIDGRYVCITFDDGYKNNFTNAFPILMEQNVKAAFFVSTDYIGDPSSEHPPRKWVFRGLPFETLTWDECRRMASEGMTIGSHTLDHPRLIELDRESVTAQLLKSKKKIEAELCRPCIHFSCPFGRLGTAFDKDRDPVIAKEIGFRSFLTTVRGRMVQGDSAYFMRRYTMGGYLGNYRMKFSLSF
jgi:peptidoglycan/xylan/chitin deacetylase (PgdA/CDA1 family)